MAGKVGFIGLGAMGGPMAANLVKHGFALVVHDIDPAKVERLRALGATAPAPPRRWPPRSSAPSAWWRRRHRPSPSSPASTGIVAAREAAATSWSA